MRPFFPAVVALLFAPALAGAQTPDAQAAIATALFQQASAEMDQKSYASACRKLEEATRLAPEALGAKLKLAQCYEAEGKLASAWAQYSVIRDIAERAGQTPRAKRAAAGASALEGKLATLTLEVPAPVRAIPGLVITRDGTQVGEGQWGTPLPVDKGTHSIVAAAPGREPWKRQVVVEADGARPTVVVEAPAAAHGARSAGPLPASAAPRSSVTKPLPEATSPAPDRPWQKPAGIAAAASGVAGLVAGGVLGGVAIAKYTESNRDGRCDARNVCDPRGLALRDEALRLGDASTALFIVGGAALLGGVVLLAMAPGPTRQGSPATGAALVVVPGGAQVRGAF